MADTSDPAAPRPTLPRIVIVGAGFGGIEAARALDGVPATVTLIDRHNYHCFQPLLYQVACAALSPAEIAWPIRHILRRQENLTVLMAEVSAVDPVARRVQAGSLSIPYDHLVLATGATHSYFGHDEWAAAAPGLKQIDDATKIRRELLIAFERAEMTQDATEKSALLSFVIIGGGSTGVEVAGAVAEVARHALLADFRHIDLKSTRIILIEAGPRLLPAMPEDLSAYTRRVLEAKGVEVMTGTRVTGCDTGGVDTEPAGRIAARTLIWAAGVKASPAATWLGLAGDRAGRIEVGPDLSISGHREIFAIGDTATTTRPDGQPVPGIAPAAKQMGRYVGRLLKARIAGEAAPKPFHYRHVGDLATIGRNSAVVRLGRLHLKGFVAWVFWSTIHVFFLIGARNRLIVAYNWLWSYLTFQRGARLITGQDEREAPDGRKSSPV